MRKLTTSELEAELQVGTVDLAEVELVLPLEQSIAEFVAAVAQITDENLDVFTIGSLVRELPAPPIETFLLAQASRAAQTRQPDTRAAAAVADADLIAAISP